MTKIAAKNVENLTHGCVILSVLLTPTIFFRGVLDSFDLTKATILWIVMSPVVVLLFATASKRSYNTLSAAVAPIFLLAAIVVTMFSIRPGSSVFGQYQRYTGLLTIGMALSIYVIIARDMDNGRRDWIRTTLCVSALTCAVYVCIQALDADPWSWASPGQNKPFFGTMGNINTSAGLLGGTSPLFVFGLIRGRTHWVRAGYVFGLLFVGAAIGLNQSFQGNVAGSVCVVLLIAIGLRASTVIEMSLLLLTAVAFFASGLYVDSKKSLLVVLPAFVVLSLAVAHFARLNFAEQSWLAKSPKRSRTSFATFGVAIVGAGLVLGPRILDEVRAGMNERAAFYRSAFLLWKDRPFLGFGPETYGYLFSIHRPAWHALNFEANRPSSAHSVPLGILVSGGIVLFVVYLLFVTVVVRRGYASVRDADGKERWLRLCVFGGFIASFIQSTVSVEHVGLIVVFFALAGLTAATGDDFRASVGTFQTSPLVRRHSSILLPLMLVVPLLVLPQLTRPFRADLQARRGLEFAYSQNDLEAAEASMRKAANLAPWDPQQQLRLVSVLQSAGDPQRAAPEAEKLSDMFNCLPSVSIGAAYLAATVSDFSKATQIARCAIDHDPNSQVVREAVSELYAQMGEASANASRFDVARQFIADALTLDPDNPRARAIEVSLAAEPE